MREGFGVQGSADIGGIYSQWEMLVITLPRGLLFPSSWVAELWRSLSPPFLSDSSAAG